ncbi:MAG: tetratricopeptide repeat protein [Xanthobacteraceae bacterium]
MPWKEPRETPARGSDWRRVTIESGRFDLSDRAYAQAIRLVGETTDILNNLGYSYMLRGNYRAARKKLMQAYRREPDNPTIANNLQLLNGSDRAVRRNPDQ